MIKYSCCIFISFQRGYLETFGYLKKGRPEVGNLQLMTHEHEYEDELRIAIKTLQVSIYFLIKPSIS